MKLKNRDSQKRKNVKTQLLMLTVSTSKLSPRLKKKPESSNKCLLQEKPLLSKRSNWNKREWPMSQLSQLRQSNRKRTMVTSRLSKKPKPRWLPLKKQWKRVLPTLIER